MDNPRIRTYRDLLVWQRGIEIAVAVYNATESFPASELYGLTGQMRRGAVSIPSNIAEGFGRRESKNYRRFLIVAMSSLFELETQLLISSRLGFLGRATYDKLCDMVNEEEAMLQSLINKLR